MYQIRGGKLIGTGISGITFPKTRCSEIPYELSRLTISSHEKRTFYFKRGNNMLLPLLWLYNPLKSTLLCSCIIETSSVLPRKSSVIFGNLRQMIGNDWPGLRTTFGETSAVSVRKPSEIVKKSMLV